MVGWDKSQLLSSVPKQGRLSPDFLDFVRSGVPKFFTFCRLKVFVSKELTPELENMQVANFVQALLGEIRPELRYISIGFSNPKIAFRFVLDTDSAACRDAIKDIALEFEAMQDGLIDLNLIIETHRDDPSIPDQSERLIYSRFQQE